jgi:hypothetical protein
VAGGHALNIKQGSGPRSSFHPRRIRPGQMFFPLMGRRRLRMIVKRLDGEWVRVIREDGSEVSLALDRLLASDGKGNGCHYRFHGWNPRPRGYRTELRVIRLVPEAARCVLALPEWDPAAEVEESLLALPEEMRTAGAVGSCMANLASPSAAGLEIHSCRRSKVRDASREAERPHPELLVKGQRFRRRSDGKGFRLIDADGPRVGAWSGRRVVRLSSERLLAVAPDGRGEHFEYLGGGVTALRRKRGKRPRGGTT